MSSLDSLENGNTTPATLGDIFCFLGIPIGEGALAGLGLSAGLGDIRAVVLFSSAGGLTLEGSGNVDLEDTFRTPPGCPNTGCGPAGRF